MSPEVMAMRRPRRVGTRIARAIGNEIREERTRPSFAGELIPEGPNTLESGHELGPGYCFMGFDHVHCRRLEELGGRSCSPRFTGRIELPDWRCVGDELLERVGRDGLWMTSRGKAAHRVEGRKSRRVKPAAFMMSGVVATSWWRREAGTGGALLTVLCDRARRARLFSTTTAAIDFSTPRGVRATLVTPPAERDDHLEGRSG